MKTLNKAHQTGAVLMISLVILLILTLLGVSGMNTTVLQERMAGNVQEMNTAFQAAEAGLRDGELDIDENFSNVTTFKVNCTSGRCEPAAYGDVVVWNSASLDVWNESTKSTAYGANTSNTSFPRVAEPPRYIVERLQVPTVGEDLEKTSFSLYWYRVTASGSGVQAAKSTTEMVQSVYRK